MSSVLSHFSDKPVFGLPIDDVEQFTSILNSQGVDLQSYLDRYKVGSYQNIELLFTSSPIKLNLGGESEKSRLIPTDKSNGVFDFSLALNGMYKVPEYYSQSLADKYPNLFHEFELPSGVVPNNLVKDKFVDGKKQYYYENNGEEFDCVLQQKGMAAIEQGIANAKKKYATTNRKVYLTFKRNRGKVKYVEIYSLFYYTDLNGDIEYAVRHLPAIMLAEYLESIGVKVRFYMTRFVKLIKQSYRMRKNDPDTGLPLPMYSMLPAQSFVGPLFVMPIIVKDFGQDFDKMLSLLVSSENIQKLYQTFAAESLRRETVNTDPSAYGEPRHSKEAYLTGFARYREKYFDYVEKGLLKTKEVLPEAMIFFHDIVIKERLSNFTEDAQAFVANWGNKANLYISPEINPLFAFWMQTSSKNLKHKIELINSNELRKDLANIQKEVIAIKDEFDLMVQNVPDKKPISSSNYSTLKDFYRIFGRSILRGYKILDGANELDFVGYIKDIEIEITTYADGIIYPTKEKTQEKMDELFININDEIKNFS